MMMERPHFQRLMGSSDPAAAAGAAYVFQMEVCTFSCIDWLKKWVQNVYRFLGFDVQDDDDGEAPFLKADGVL